SVDHALTVALAACEVHLYPHGCPPNRSTCRDQADGLIRCRGRPPRRASRRRRTGVTEEARKTSDAFPPTCGVKITLSRSKRGGPGGSGSGSVKPSAPPAMVRSRSAARRAWGSPPPPRAVLTR